MMTFTRSVMSPEQAKSLMAYLQRLPMPFTVSVSDGAIRTNEQNRLYGKWRRDVAAQVDGWTAEDVRAHAKLHFGVPILRSNDAWRAEYDRLIKPLPYKDKLRLMGEPFDFGVTRKMTTKQLTEFLDTFARHWTGEGVKLTEP